MSSRPHGRARNGIARQRTGESKRSSAESTSVGVSNRRCKSIFALVTAATLLRRPECVPLVSAVNGSAETLVMLVGYYATVALDARSPQGEDTKRFVAAVRKHLLDHDLLCFFGTVGNSVRFHLLRNEPAVTLTAVRLRLNGWHGPGRMLFLTRAAGERTLKSTGLSCWTLLRARPRR